MLPLNSHLDSEIAELSSGRETQDERALARVLIARTRTILWISLAIGVVFTVLDMVASPPRTGPFYVKCVGLSSIISGLLLLRAAWAQRRALVVSMAVILAAYALTALSGMLSPSREYQTSTLLFVGASLTTAIIMPWGWRAQLVTMMFAAFVLCLAVLRAHGHLWAFTGDPSAAVVVVFALSVAIANEMQRYRLTLWRELAARRQAESEVRDLNADLERRVAARTAQLKVANQQLRALSARLEDVREEERTRIAREIHDELGQGLTALKIDLDLLPSRVSNVGYAVGVLMRQKFEAMSELADAMIRSVRRIAADLRPSLLDDLGLPAAIEWQAREFENHCGVHCTVVCDSGSLTLDTAHATALFRIVQESLTNVARHADASNVRITLRSNVDGAVLEVADDGCGVTEQDLGNPESLGLLGIRERAQVLGGQAEFQSAPGHGTTVVVRLPLQN